MWRAVLLLSICLGAEPPLARAMLAGHNQVRARVGVPALIWSNKLEAVAQEWANRLIARREFGHRAGGEYGENLYAISGGRATEAMVIAAWAGESIDYDIKSNRCRDVCGHYTQMVWADTKRVGCAVARGGGREVWVCNYDPPGNWAGQRPYTVSAGTIASTEPGVHLDPVGVVNAASLAPSGAGLASSLPFPATSGGVRVEIDETAAPAYAVSPTQIIELIPLQTNRNTASFVAGNGGSRSSDSPGCPRASSFQRTSRRHRARRGETLHLVLTGTGSISPPVDVAAVALPAPPPAGRCPLRGPCAGLGGSNFTVPGNAPPGQAVSLEIQTPNALHSMADLAIQ